MSSSTDKHLKCLSAITDIKCQIFFTKDKTTTTKKLITMKDNPKHAKISSNGDKKHASNAALMGAGIGVGSVAFVGRALMIY